MGTRFFIFGSVYVEFSTGRKLLCRILYRLCSRLYSRIALLGLFNTLHRRDQILGGLRSRFCCCAIMYTGSNTVVRTAAQALGVPCLFGLAYFWRPRSIGFSLSSAIA